MTLIPRHAILELTPAGAPEWWADDACYTLAETTLAGQVKVTVYKSTDCVLHIYALAGDLVVREEVPLVAPTRRPFSLFIGWDENEVRLQLDWKQTTRHPWRTLPLPPRP